MITEIRLRNFKSFRDATVRLGPFSLVIGANGAGKSNLFDALRFLHFLGRGSSIRDAIEGHASPSAAAVAVPGIRGGSRGITHLQDPSSVFHLEVRMVTPQGPIDYRISVDSESFKVVSETLAADRHPWEYVFDTHPTTAPLAQERESPVILARYYKNNRGTNPKRSFGAHESILSQFKDRAADSNLNEHFANAAREELATIKPLELRPEVLRQYSALGQFSMGEHGENFAALVWMLDQESQWDDGDPSEDARQRLAAIQNWLSELTPHPVSQVRPEEAPTGEVIFALREHPFDQALTARSLSDGTLRFAALTFEVLGVGGRRTLVIEEVENGINPARLVLLVRLLQTASETEPGLQVIASTHAPGILDYASESVLSDSVFIGWDAETQGSCAIPLMSIPSLEEVRPFSSMGDLQSEGWFQAAMEAR